MSHIATCPHCSTRLRVADHIADRTLICPHCLAALDNPQPRTQVRATEIDTDVKRGLSAGSVVLALLIGLSIVGIVTTFSYLNEKPGIPEERYVTGFLVLFCFFALEVLVSIAVVRGLIRWGTSGARVPSVGKVIGITFLSLGTAAAIVIFFFVTCFGLLMLNQP